jgi:hypothetical protein
LSNAANVSPHGSGAWPLVLVYVDVKEGSFTGTVRQVTLCTPGVPALRATPAISEEFHASPQSSLELHFLFPENASIRSKELTFCARLYDTAGHYVTFGGKIDGPSSPAPGEGDTSGQGGDTGGEGDTGDQGDQGGQGGQTDQGGQGGQTDQDGGSTSSSGTGSTP